MRHDFCQQKRVVHLGHLHKLARTNIRSDIVDVKDGWDTLIPLVQHVLETENSSFALWAADLACTVRVEKVIHFTLNIRQLDSSSVVVEVNLAVLRPYQTSAVLRRKTWQWNIHIVVKLARRGGCP
jgi:hypothetical protein